MTKEEFESQGYFNVKKIQGKWCGLQRFMFTVGLVCELDEWGYGYRYCYESRAEAIAALDIYDDLSQHPSGDWIKRKGRGGDLVNPNIKQEEFES